MSAQRPISGRCPRCRRRYTRARRDKVACRTCCDTYAEGRYDDALAAYDRAARTATVDKDGLAFRMTTKMFAKTFARFPTATPVARVPVLSNANV